MVANRRWPETGIGVYVGLPSWSKAALPAGVRAEVAASTTGLRIVTNFVQSLGLGCRNEAGARTVSTATVSGELLAMLRCPLSRAPLVLVDDWLYSTDPSTRRRYPIRDGIPVMLMDESQEVSPDEFARVIGRSVAAVT